MMYIMGDKASNLLNSIARYIVLVVIGVILVLNIFISTNVGLSVQEVVEWSYSQYWWLLYLVLSGLLLYLCRGLKSWQIHLIGGLLYLSWFIGVQIWNNYMAFADQKDVLLIAESAVVGKPLDKHLTLYLNRYPHQIGMVFYNMGLLSVSKLMLFPQLVNVVWCYLSNIMVGKVSKLLWGDEDITRISILLSYLFLVVLNYNSFIYGTVPSMFFLLVLWYLYVKFKGCYNLWYVLGMFICGYIAVSLRQNTQIFLLALIIGGILGALKSNRVKQIVMVIVLSSLLVMPAKVNEMVYESITGNDVGRGLSAYSWVAMGLYYDEDDVKAPGWFNSLSLEIDHKAQYDRDKGVEIAKGYIQDSVKRMVNDPQYLGGFMYKKFTSTWNDATFQAVWSSYIPNVDPHKLVAKFYEDKGYYIQYYNYLKAVYIIILLGVCYYLSRYKVLDARAFPVLIYIVGGVLFHLIWETKSQYVWPYIYVLIPFSGYSVHKLFSYIGSKLIKKRGGEIG